MFEACYSIFVLFAVCELCQRATDSFVDIDDIIDEFDWYLFPIKVQKLLPTIMIMAQKPITIECFGSILCNRSTFKEVCLISKIIIQLRCIDIRMCVFLFLGC